MSATVGNLVSSSKALRANVFGTTNRLTPGTGVTYHLPRR